MSGWWYKLEVDIKKNSEVQYLKIRFVGVRKKEKKMPDGAPSAESALLKSAWIFIIVSKI